MTDLTQVSSEENSLIQKSKSLNDSLFIRSWLESKSKNTRRSYERVSDEFMLWIHPRSLAETTIHDVQIFTSHKSNERRASQALRLSVIKSLYSFATRTGYLKANLGSFLPKISGTSKIAERYLTAEEVKAMIEACSSKRDEAILRLLYNGGLRVSELLSLKVKDLIAREDGEAQLKILGKGSKERTLRISFRVFDALKEVIRDHSKETFIFLSDEITKKTLTDRAVRKLIFKCAIRAGIRKKVSPHWLRHAHASHALDNGAPLHLVQATLGHASVATTGRYLHARPNESSGKYLGD